MGVMDCCSGPDKSTNFKDAKEKGNDITMGPVKKRGCTDILCLVIFLVHWAAFIVICFAGIQDGKISKLYAPRDFSGAYCGEKENWNSDLNLENVQKLSYTMNVSHTVDQIAKQFMCSTTAKAVLETSLSSAEYQNYLCECCLSQCAKCAGSLRLGGDLATGAALNATISSRITAVTSNSVEDLYNPSGSNGDMFGSMWSSATSYLTQVCLESCDVNYLSSRSRTYNWKPGDDNPLKTAWASLATSSSSDITEPMALFSFSALPFSQCPYDTQHCVPFPGVTFKEMALGDWCEMEMGSAVSSAVGSAAASAYANLGNSDVADAGSESLGELMGDLQKSFLATVIVGFVAFVIGFIFLVLLRFCLGFCVWVAMFSILVFFLLAGLLAYVYSFQCKDASIFDTGKQTAVAVAAAGTSVVESAVTGETYSEALTGDGADYRGRQTVTIDGVKCQRWDASDPHVHGFTAANFPNSGLEENFCRNPYNTGDALKGNTIWCLTTDSEQIWGECMPIGQITTGECENGYELSSETVRQVCEILAYVIWGLGGLWLLLIICYCGQIKDAIAICKTARSFMIDNPMIWVVPCIQVLMSFIWLTIWIPLAGLLLSQVPDGFTSKDAFATYAEAAGTEETPGACTDTWPTGFTYKDEACPTVDGVVKCWRCAPPRYVFDWRSFYAVFVFLWNNAFLIACGQCILAGAVVVWFFAPQSEKAKVASMREAVKPVVRYHLGSLAFGSFILAVVQFLRFIAFYLEKNAQAQKNYVMKLIAQVIGCLLACLEKSVKFLTKLAYIQVALMGTNFCTSAWKAFQLMFKSSFWLARSLGAVVYFIGWVFVMVLTAISGYFIVRGLYPDISFVAPVIMYIAIGYLVGKLLMNVFSLAVDTSLQCYLAVKEMDPDKTDFDFVPKPLADRIGKKGKKKPEADKDASTGSGGD